MVWQKSSSGSMYIYTNILFKYFPRTLENDRSSTLLTIFGQSVPDTPGWHFSGFRSFSSTLQFVAIWPYFFPSLWHSKWRSASAVVALFYMRCPLGTLLTSCHSHECICTHIQRYNPASEAPTIPPPNGLCKPHPPRIYTYIKVKLKSAPALPQKNYGYQVITEIAVFQKWTKLRCGVVWCAVL